MAKEIMPGQMTATCAGTPLTMDPDCLKEQKYTAKADLFSLGVLLFYLITGSVPLRCSVAAGAPKGPRRGQVLDSNGRQHFSGVS